MYAAITCKPYNVAGNLREVNLCHVRLHMYWLAAMASPYRQLRKLHYVVELQNV
jgi:hypothetical protein